MGKLSRSRNVAILVSSAMLCTAVLPMYAHANVPSDVEDLVGARGSSGEMQLTRRGYEHINTKTGSDRKWSYWWNQSRKQCISVTTYDGRYDAIEKTTSKDCGKSGDGGKTAAIALGAAALIGAIAIASSGKKKDKDKYYYPEGSSGTTPYELRDLVGVKASSGERQMKNRGYKYQSSGSGNYTRWGYWWNKRENQCVGVTTYDGRYREIVSTPDYSCGKGGGYRPGGPSYGYGNGGSYSPSSRITCYPAQRACYEAGRGYSAYWSSREFRY
ncbi:MAG: hypothetical protein AB7U35_12285 [Sphingobium sp.]